MPRYYFHVRHDRYHRDEEGEDLPDRSEAWHVATRSAGEALKDIDGKLKPGKDWQLEVTDECATVLFRLVISAEKVV